MNEGENEVPEKCKSCRFLLRTPLFNLCTHASSEYSIAGQHDHHTVKHMRYHGPCVSAALWQPV